MDIGDIQASSRKTIGAVSKTPIENRGPASGNKEARRVLKSLNRAHPTPAKKRMQEFSSLHGKFF
jgi:hypothetical protein